MLLRLIACLSLVPALLHGAPAVQSLGRRDVPPAVLAKADSLFGDAIGAIASVQEAYAKSRGGRFWQGLDTHPVKPADGQPAPPDLDRKPTDQAESWRDLGIALPATTEISYRVDVYDGPLGRGWVFIAQFRVGTNVLTRAEARGPEAHRTLDWH